MRRARGFTLLEVVIAIAISAIIAVMAFASLDGASRAAERTSEVLDEINRVDRAWQIIAADLRHLLPPDGRNTVFQAQTLQSPGEHAAQQLLLFQRRGWVNFSNQLRSDLQLVGYRVDEGGLWRHFMPEYNRDISQIDLTREGYRQRLLEGVEDVQLRFLHQGALSLNGKGALEGNNYSDNWLQRWPDPTQSGASALPLAVEIRLTIKGVGTSVRLFAIPQI